MLRLLPPLTFLTLLVIVFFLLASMGCGVGWNPGLVPPADEPACSTECGLTWYGPAETCDQFKEAETAAVAALAQVPGWSRQLVCDRIYGYAVVERDPPASDPKWFTHTALGLRANQTGITWCPYGVIELLKGQWLWSGTLAHEFSHATEWCLSDHWQWGPRGIDAAVSTTERGRD